MTLYDFCVVGAGLVGSSAAKWLSLKQDAKVCLIGPEEPTGEEWLSGSREVFGSHYDEGRITRELDHVPVWGQFAQRSIERYRDIEQQSGIKFYHEVGCIFIDKKDLDGLRKYLECADELVIQHEVFGPEEFHKRFPYLRIREEGCECIWTPKKAGHISARGLVAAQQRIAELNGCDRVRQVVVKVTEEATSEGQEFVQIVCEDGSIVKAARVLLCTGAFTNFHDLLPAGKRLKLKLNKTLVVRLELSEADVARLSSCPSLSLENENFFALPPIKYPDGKYYLKAGFCGSPEKEVENLAEAATWFKCRGGHIDTTKLMECINNFIPDLNPVSITTDCCIPSSAPSRLPYCDMAGPRVGVLAGMKGVGAKSSDELGRMGALMISGPEWEYDLPADLFKLQFKE